MRASTSVTTRIPSWESRLVGAPTVRLLAVGRRAALFCERRQQLFELNATAELIWRSLTAGATPAAVAQDLQAQGATTPEALAFVTTSAGEWLRTGLLVPKDLMRRQREQPDLELSLRIDDLTGTIALHTPKGDALAGELCAAFGQFITDGPETGLRISVLADPAGYFLLLDEVPLGLLDAERVVPELKAVLTDRLAKSVRGDCFLLHAALLASGRRGLLISGAPGAGKTTLTLALAARGLGYACDDIVKVCGDGAFRGVRFSPASKTGGWDLVSSYLPEVGRLTPHLRADGQRVRYVPVKAFAGGEVDALGWALLLERRDGAAATLQPLEPLTVVAELLSAAFSADHSIGADTLEAFVASFTDLECRRLVYSDLASAVVVIEKMIRG